ncbi:enoyl-CoA hydratase/isomerase family protein [Pseudooceanicola sediminis]|uniref:Enoyl-CoA hydratase/isomerase family protein n=1 Tax=Pseudooceanicola sediminis TaxID=2211117 RepID=A0A399IZF0_9RHOB|nr:enoyl-CoA hydratase/isomerase family protein [Pseudooceanicola sediminis]KAA2313458.1 enoyl-CoA hydratase/isomerase family protein [Puniceibacterium sp. HSS470]RII38435.1 enoyl-CoA hydratase/isomerase family protein [Pseudooceanicola sediminis]
MRHQERAPGQWIVTIDRPEKANSLTPEMLETLCNIVEKIQKAQSVILTGTGAVFSAGADLEAARKGLGVSPLWERLSAGVAAVQGLTIAALNGTLAGGAMGMALACDLRIAVPDARLFYPVMRLGFLPQPSDPGRLVALVGPARAKLILMGGQRITAQEALWFGLIDRIVDGDVVDAALMLTTDVMAAETTHVAAIKRMI